MTNFARGEFHRFVCLGIVLCYAVVNLGKQSLYLVNQSGTVTLDSLTPNKRILIARYC